MGLTIIYGWANELIDVKGAFLCGNFNGEQPIYIKVPEGFETYYPDSVIDSLANHLWPQTSCKIILARTQQSIVGHVVQAKS